MTRRSGAIVLAPDRQPSRLVLLDALQAGLICQAGCREYRIMADRRWRLDLAWPPHQIAVELQGGAYIGGHHVRGHGFEDDCEKILTAAAAGWRIIPITWGMLEHRFRDVLGLLDRAIGCTNPMHAGGTTRPSSSVVNNSQAAGTPADRGGGESR